MAIQGVVIFYLILKKICPKSHAREKGVGDPGKSLCAHWPLLWTQRGSPASNTFERGEGDPTESMGDHRGYATFCGPIREKDHLYLWDYSGQSWRGDTNPKNITTFPFRYTSVRI